MQNRFFVVTLHRKIKIQSEIVIIMYNVCMSMWFTEEYFSILLAVEQVCITIIFYLCIQGLNYGILHNAIKRINSTEGN